MFACGLQALAGGRLFNVVVDTDTVAKQLLERGRLTNRVTFIPLNKIASQPLRKDEVEAAKRSGGRDNVWYPLDLIKYEAALESAVIHVLGRSLLCRDIHTAGKVCMDVKIDCCTLDGDKVSYTGAEILMSGGAPPRGNDILKDLCSVHHQEVELNDRIRELKSIEEQLRKISHVAVKERKQKLKDLVDQVKKCKKAAEESKFQDRH